MKSPLEALIDDKAGPAPMFLNCKSCAEAKPGNVTFENWQRFTVSIAGDRIRVECVRCKKPVFTWGLANPERLPVMRCHHPGCGLPPGHVH